MVSWIEFVKDYAKKNNIKYGEALKQAKSSWEEHKKKTGHTTKSKAKSKAKAKKGKKVVLKVPTAKEVKDRKKEETLAFQLERDAQRKVSGERAKAREEYLEQESKKKSYTDFLMEARNSGVSAGEAPAVARKKVAEQNLKLQELKSKAGIKDTPTGGSITGGELDESVFKGVRKTKIAKYKKLKLKVDKAIKEGNVVNKDFNTLLQLAKHLAGESKTNQYAKYAKKLEKQMKSKAYQQASRRQIRQAQKESLKELKLAKAEAQDKARSQRKAESKVIENRKNQLIRLGATQEEAETIAREEQRQIRESTQLQRELQLEKYRKAGKTNIATGGLSYQQFVDKLSRDKGISYTQAVNLSKQQNLFTKYQISAIKNAPSVGMKTISQQSILPTPPTIPPQLVGRTKYLTKGGKVKGNFIRGIDTLLAKYGEASATKGSNDPANLFKITKSKAQLAKDLAKVSEYSAISQLDSQRLDRLKELVGELEDYSQTGLDTQLRLRRATSVPRGRSVSRSVSRSASGARTPSPPRRGKKARSPSPIATPRGFSPPPRRAPTPKRQTTNPQLNEAIKKASLSRAGATSKGITDALFNEIAKTTLVGYDPEKAGKQDVFKTKAITPSNRYRRLANAILSDASLGDDEKYEKLRLARAPLEDIASGITSPATTISKEDEAQAIVDLDLLGNLMEDLDEDIEGAGLTPYGGSFSLYDENDLLHDGGQEEKEQELTGGDLREIGSKFSSSLTRKLQQIPEPINLVIRGVGKIQGRKVKKQNSIDQKDRHLLEMTIDSYSKPQDRRGNIDGYEYEPVSSNEAHAVWINHALQKVIVAYRGSRTQEDWLESDKFIAKGKLEESPRYKREFKWTEKLLEKVPADYDVEFTGSSLGGTLAYTLGHAHKQRAVVFNPGVGIDGAKKHGDDNTKMYHSEGDPISVMGVGHFKDNVMLRNTAGNFGSAHSTASLLPANEGGFAKGKLDPITSESQTEQSKEIAKANADLNPRLAETIASTESKEEIERLAPPPPSPIADADSNQPLGDQPTNPSHYGDLGDFTPKGQTDIENMTQRDIDTYYYRGFAPSLPTGAGLAFDNIANNTIKELGKVINRYEKTYTPKNIDNALMGGTLDMMDYKNAKDKHDIHLNTINRLLLRLQGNKKRVSKNMKDVVQAHITKYGEHLNYLVKNVAPLLPRALDLHLSNQLGHDNRRLSDLHIHGNIPSGGSFTGGAFPNYQQYNKHHDQVYKASPEQDEREHKRIGMIIEKIPHIKKKIESGKSLSSREHEEIRMVSGKHLNKLRLNPHYHHYIKEI